MKPLSDSEGNARGGMDPIGVQNDRWGSHVGHVESLPEWPACLVLGGCWQEFVGKR